MSPEGTSGGATIEHPVRRENVAEDLHGKETHSMGGKVVNLDLRALQRRRDAEMMLILRSDRRGDKGDGRKICGHFP